MMARSHIVFGFSSTILTFSIFGATPSVLAVIAGMVGSLSPDLDDPKSSLGRVFPFISWPLNLMLGHRGITHSLLFSLIIGGIIYLFSDNLILVAFLIGYLSHILGDYITARGVPLLYVPYLTKKKRMVLPFTGFRVGGFMEQIIVLALLISSVYFIWINGIVLDF